MNLTRHNYEEYFLLYVDGELDPGDRLAVETFLAEHPDLGEVMDDLRRTVLSPEETYVFDKDLLYRPAEDRQPSRIIALGGRRLFWAAAAAILLLGSAALLLLQHQQAGPAVAAVRPPEHSAPGTAPVATTPATNPVSNPTTIAAAAPATNPASIAAATPVVPASGAPAPPTRALAAQVQRSTRDLAASRKPAMPKTARKAPVVVPTPEIPALQIPDASDGRAVAEVDASTHAPAIPIRKPAKEKNPAPAVTTAAPVSYHTLEDGDQTGNDKILFVNADEVVKNGEVKGFFRRAGRLLKHTASIGTDR